MKKLNCIIYGGGGFIGSHLCESLMAKGHNVVVFDRIGFDKRNINSISDKIEIIEGDFNNVVNVRESLVKVDVVYHLISSTTPSVSMDNPYFDVESNLIPSIGLLNEITRQKRIKQIVFLSSGGTVYGIPATIPIPESHQTIPICSYGIIKNTIEHYILLYQKTYGISCKIFRLSNPYGERQNPLAKQGVIPVFLNKILLGQPVQIWGDGNVIRDYVYIKDVCDLLAESISVHTSNSIYNIGSGVGLSLNQLLEVMAEVTKCKPIIEYRDGRGFDVPINILDVNLVKNDYSWSAKTNINDGLLRLLNYLKNFY